MGGALNGDQQASDSSTPGFMIAALKDPSGANLDRIQVIKGWHDANGELQEKVYNVQGSDGRKVRRNGSLKALKNTVNLDDATYSNSVGAASLAAYWQDPDFDPTERAFYYARVIEITTPRWTAYDRVRLGHEVSPLDDQLVQDRAYSSPIWYSPK